MKSNRKIKILFVHSQLVQHGSERYLFEICKALDKNKFDIHILTRFFLIRNNFYYPLLQGIGCKIHARLVSLRHLRYPIKSLYNKSEKVRNVVKLFHGYLIQIIYCNYFRKFDVIAVIGIETYCDALSPVLDKYKNIILHHLFHEYQFERNYFNELNQNKIVIMDEKQKHEILKSFFSDIILYEMPLVMNFENRLNIGLTKKFSNNVIRVGIFSRLFKDRPNEPLFKCFAEFIKKYNSQTELYFYGDGDSTQYNELLENLNISDFVFFRGHSKSISDSIISDNIDILWLCSMGKSMGYSSIEISSYGMPMVYWNLDNSDYSSILTETRGAMHSFNRYEEFVDFNCYILRDQQLLRDVGQKLRNYVIDYYSIDKNIKNLEKIYLENTINSPY